MLGLTIKLGKKPQIRSTGFVEAEAHAILSAALNYIGGEREKARTVIETLPQTRYEGIGYYVDV